MPQPLRRRRRRPGRNPECAALAELRLQNDWTWNELYTRMKAARCEIPMRTLHYQLTQFGVQPRDRAIYKMRTFLNRVTATR